VAYGFDPVRLEILWGGLLSIVEEMSITLKSCLLYTSPSPRD